MEERVHELERQAAKARLAANGQATAAESVRAAATTLNSNDS
jgi:hypothetical protein